MNIEETKAAIAVMQAYVDGKEIEVEARARGYQNFGWSVDRSPGWSWGSFNYRVRVTKPSINWDHVAPKYICLFKTVGGRHVLTYSKPTFDDKALSWWGDDIDATQFASFKPGTCDWKDSLVIRPGYEG